jgi:hypothetical protein
VVEETFDVSFLTDLFESGRVLRDTKHRCKEEKQVSFTD